MKQAYELFQEMKPETALSLFRYLRDEQREVYKATVNSLAKERKLRPVFIQRKSLPDQIEWMLKNVKLRGGAEVAAQILQLWLLKAQTPVLTEFLDGLGIPHDGEGAADDIPDELDAKKVKSTVAALVKKHDPEVVAIYLNIFQTQKEGGWPELEAVIEGTPALRLGGAAAPSAPAADEASEAAAEESPEEAAEESSQAEKKSPAKKASKTKASEDAGEDS